MFICIWTPNDVVRSIAPECDWSNRVYCEATKLGVLAHRTAWFTQTEMEKYGDGIIPMLFTTEESARAYMAHHWGFSGEFPADVTIDSV